MIEQTKTIPNGFTCLHRCDKVVEPLHSTKMIKSVGPKTEYTNISSYFTQNHYSVSTKHIIAKHGHKPARDTKDWDRGCLICKTCIRIKNWCLDKGHCKSQRHSDYCKPGKQETKGAKHISTKRMLAGNIIKGKYNTQLNSSASCDNSSDDGVGPY